MAKKKEDKSEPIKVLTAEDAKKVNWAEPEKYDFFDTPREVREILVPSFLEWSFEHYQRELYDKYKKRISQTHYAMKTIGIDDQLFSLYKTGNRYPTTENADILAAWYGPIFWDIAGYSRRMPRNKMLYDLADSWPKLRDKDQAELRERARNLIDNNEVREDAADTSPRDVYYT